MSAKLKYDQVKASLKERIKELECLYKISELAYTKQTAPLDELLSEIVHVLPAGWQYPEITEACICIDGSEYKTQNFNKKYSLQSSEIIINKTRRGEIRIAYTTQKPELDEGPFLKEERALINSIAKKLAIIIERHDERKEKILLETKLMHADRLVTIGELTAGIAHELNEPLGSILGFAQLIKSEIDESKTISSDIDKIIKASMHAREVIRKLMIFSKYEETPTETVNINAIVNDGLYLLESRCKKENVEIVRILEEHLPLIEANSVQMHQVIVNLCVNAIQAMPNGGKLIIQTRATDDHVIVVVQDTGIGISEDYLSKIFNPFFTMKDSETNTGLGLSVVHGIVSSLGGTISVESNLGVGTRFEIKYPYNNEA